MHLLNLNLNSSHALKRCQSNTDQICEFILFLACSSTLTSSSNCQQIQPEFPSEPLLCLKCLIIILVKDSNVLVSKSAETFKSNLSHFLAEKRAKLKSENKFWKSVNFWQASRQGCFFLIHLFQVLFLITFPLCPAYIDYPISSQNPQENFNLK